MACHLDHDLLKLGGRNKTIMVGIKVSECLSDTLSPEPLEQLCKLLKADNVVAPALAEVQLDPVAVKVERCLGISECDWSDEQGEGTHGSRWLPGWPTERL